MGTKPRLHMKTTFHEKQKLKYYEEKKLYNEMAYIVHDFIIYYSTINTYPFGIHDCVRKCPLSIRVSSVFGHGF